ncbi:MAG UNVERIFIED_CONTAM: hypothetical protein LVR18_03060 [Planctomycetaceae bacterium]
MAGNSSISTGSGNVLLASISVGASTLTIPATSGTITVTGAVTGAGTLAVQTGTSTGNVTFSGNVSLGTLTFGPAAVPNHHDRQQQHHHQCSDFCQHGRSYAGGWR